MSNKTKPKTLAEEVRNVLAATKDALTSSAIYERCTLAATTTDVSSALFYMNQRGEVVRTVIDGNKNRYAFALNREPLNNRARTSPVAAPSVPVAAPSVPRAMPMASTMMASVLQLLVQAKAPMTFAEILACMPSAATNKVLYNTLYRLRAEGSVHREKHGTTQRYCVGSANTMPVVAVGPELPKTPPTMGAPLPGCVEALPDVVLPAAPHVREPTYRLHDHISAALSDLDDLASDAIDHAASPEVLRCLLGSQQALRRAQEAIYREIHA